MAVFDLSKFETFTKMRQAPSHDPEVILRPSGNVSINDATIRALGFEDIGAFVIMFNREEQVIALQPTDDDNPTGYKTKRSGEKLVIGPKRFLDWAGVSLDGPLRVEPEIDQDNGMLFVSLGEKKQEEPKARRGRKPKYEAAVPAQAD